MTRIQLRAIAICCVLTAVFANQTWAYIAGPYAVDGNTSHLWHFDDFGSPTAPFANDVLAQDAVTASPTFALRSSFWQMDTDASTKAAASGSTLGNTSLAGFGQSVNNTAGLFSPPDPVAFPGSGNAGMYPNLDPNVALSDNHDISDFFGTNGAFTVEGLYRVDWDPTIPHSSPSMLFMSMEEDSSTALGGGAGQRVFQIYLDFSGGGGSSSTNPRIVFDSRAEGANVNPDTAILVANTNIGTLEQGAWYHMAATFNGVLGEANNFKFYFTKVEETATQANLIASSTWTNPYPTTGTADFAVGNSARNQEGAFSGFPATPWFGAIDEVRISDTARAAGEMVFGADATFEINRTTGEITLINSGIAPLHFLSYKLTSSALGALEQSNWKSIADNYDVDHPSPEQVDPNENWTILSLPGAHTDFNEEVFAGTGATLGLGESLLLGSADAWIATSDESDLVAELKLSTNETILVPIVYSGNGGNALFSTDLNASGGAPNAADWIIFKNNYREDISGLTLAQAHQLGDMDGDIDVDAFDFQLFRHGYNAANGTGALEAVISGAAVPEPSTIAMFGFLAFAWLGWMLRRWASIRSVPAFMLKPTRLRAICGVTCAVLLTVSPVAFGDILLNYQFEEVTGTAGVDQTTTDSTGNFISTPGTINAVLGHDTNTPGTDFPNLLPGPVRNFAAGVKSRNPDNYMNFPGNPATENIGGNIERVEIAQASSGALNATFSNFTVALWLNPSSMDRDRFAIGKIGGGGQRGWQIYADENTSDMYIDYFATTGGLDRSLHLPNALPLNTWTHVIFTFDGVSQTDAVYLNNILQTPTSVGGLTSTPATLNGANSANFRVGHRGATGSAVGSWAGGIDDVMVFNETLQFTPTGSLTGTGSTLDIAPQPGITINKITGEIRFVNPTEDAIDFSLYDITSPGNHLLPTWEGLGNLNAIGTGEGEKWEKSSDPNGAYISEFFLLGNSTVAAGQSLSFGTAYETGIEESGIVFTYYDVGADQVLTGKVEFVTTVPLDGDHNGDGMVNAADYVVWRDNPDGFGGNPDGYNEWKQNFGASNGPGSGASTIPEPASLVLFGLGIACIGLIFRVNLSREI